jgi:hypothetical protein
MGNTHACVKRALTDFCSEESIGQACKRFEEHYGWKVEHSYVRREVETIAFLAEKYVESRLPELATSFKNQKPPKKICFKFCSDHIYQQLLTTPCKY